MTTIAPHRAQTATERTDDTSSAAWRVASSPWMLPTLLVVCAAVARIASWAHEPTEWDSVLLGQGVRHFDVRAESPHAPGYVLYVLAARAVHAVGLDVHDALVLVAFAASVTAVWVGWQAGRALAGQATGVLVACALAFLPLPWFYGSIAASYALDALAATILCLVLVRATPGSNAAAWAAFVLGVAGGLRTSAIVLLAPLAIATAIHAIRTRRSALIAAFALVGGVALWIVPLAIMQPGGLSAWQTASDQILDGAMNTTSPLRGAPEATRNVGTTLGYLVVIALPLVPAAVVGWCVVLSGVRRRLVPWSIVAALVASVAFPVVFFSLVHFGKAGYALVYLPPLLLLMLMPVGYVRRNARTVVVGLALVGIAFGGVRFATGDGMLPASVVDRGPWFTKKYYWAPYPETLATIRASDEDAAALRDGIHDVAPRAGRDELVMLRDQGGHLYAHASEYAPDVDVVLIVGDVPTFHARDHRWSTAAPELRSETGGRVVLMTTGPTDVTDALLTRGAATVVAERSATGTRDGFLALELAPGADVRGVPVVPPRS